MRKKILLGTALCAVLFQMQSPITAQELSLPDITASTITVRPSFIASTDPIKKEITQSAVLSHIQQTGATIHPLESLYGLRSFVAQNGDKILPFFLTPDGKAMVSGVIMNMSAEMMLKLDKNAIDRIPAIHGLEGLFVRTGDHFQVFYITPDGKKVIPGLMWDEEGRNVTQAQIAPLLGMNAPNPASTTPDPNPAKENPDLATPSLPNQALNNSSFANTYSQQAPQPSTDALNTSEKEEGGEGQIKAASVSKSSLNIFTPPSDKPSRAVFALLNQTYGGIYGKADTPELLVFIDPLCHFSKQALTLLDPYVKAGRLHLVLIPIALLDLADQGQSSQAAKRLLSVPVDQMAQAWISITNTPVSPDADQKLSVNQQMIAGLHLKGTPIFFWQRPDKSLRRFEGLPDSIEALVSQVEKGQ